MDRPRDTYREIFERSPDAILIIEGDRFVDCNPAAVRMMRCASKAELLARDAGGLWAGKLHAHPGAFSPLRQPDGRDSYEKANEMMAIASERGSHLFEWHHVRADGEVFPVEVQLTAVRGGEVPRLHVVWREIGERKRLEAELRRAQRLEAVGRLAGGIAHDFNNLLAVVLGHAERLEERLGGVEEQEHAGEIRSAAARGAALTRQLLAFSRGQPVQPRPTDLGRLVEGLSALLRSLIGEHIDLAFERPESPVVVEADPSQLERVVMNLCTNARDAVAEGGRIEIGVTSQRLCGPSATGGSARLSPGEYAVLRVRDSGEGMGPDQMERAFDPFFTTKPEGRGAGLGLATVHAIAEQNSGRAFIESHRGSGTAVEVWLPVCRKAPVELEAPPAPAPDARGDETILLVEDERAIRDLLAGELRGRGFRVLAAEDGAEALKLAEGQPGGVDLVVTDVVLPRVSGPELVRRLAEQRPSVKVLYMSGYSHAERLAAAPREERVRILEKPFSPRRLTAEVRTLLDRS